MEIVVLENVLCGGVWYEPSLMPQKVPDVVGEHLISLGVARKLEYKVVEPTVKKVAPSKKHSSASQQDQASQGPIVKKRRARKPKSSQ